MGEKSLREVCELLGVSRRVIQRYEAYHLVSYTDKTNMGHLLYDEETVERIKTIRFYQTCGFTLKEITQLLNCTDTQLKEALEKKCASLKNHKNSIESLIISLENMIRQL